MNIHEWMSKSSISEREELAKRAKTSVAYLWQLSGNHRVPSRKLAEKLEHCSREVTPNRVISRVSALFNQPIHQETIPQKDAV